MKTEQKTAFIFPGQGLQAKDIQDYYRRLHSLDNEKIIDSYIKVADNAVKQQPGILPFDMLSVLEDDIGLAHLQYTSVVQPVVYTLSILASEIAKRKGQEFIPSFVAGHSLGEYAAFTKTGVISFEQGIAIVSFRGAVMQEACSIKKSILVSVNGLTEEQIRKIFENRTVEIALINAPSFIVVGAEEHALPTIEELTKVAGAKRVTMLNTAGAFHTSFMQSAANRLGEFLAGYTFKDAEIDVVTNLDGKPTRNSYDLKNHLVAGMINPVRWADGIQFIKNAGVENFVEVGPGSSLISLNTINGVPKEKTKNILDQIA